MLEQETCAGLDYLTSPAAGNLQASAIGDALIALGGTITNPLSAIQLFLGHPSTSAPTRAGE